MKKHKLLMLFVTVIMLLCGQSANAFTLTCLRGSGFGEGEGCQKLFDGTQNTKWGTWDGWYGDPVYTVAKATMPIAPTTYSLKIANDTNDSPGRNWKSWRIFGGNFESDDAAVNGADGWVLLDQKVDQAMTTDQFAEVQFEMSNPDGNFYSYFMIIVDAICSDPNFDDYTQMDEFWFRDFKVDTSAAQTYVDFDYTTDVEADLQAAYGEKLDALKTAIATSDPDQIVPAVDAIVPLYLEITTLRDGGFIALDWTSAWGDGPGSNLIDKNDYTKWGGGFPGEGEHVQYVVFRTPAQQPYFYKLVTGGDTEKYGDRNWKTWKVFGGNFATEAEATRSAEGWVVLDEREDISTDYLPNKNNYPATLNFTKGVTTAYSYFKVEVTASGGGAQQMSEIYLCTEEEFNTIRQSLVDELAEFAAGLEEMNVTSDMEAGKITFAEKYAAFQTTTNADELTIKYNELVALKDALEESAAFANGGYRVLDGNTAWGEGENWTKLLDNNEKTKWGGGMPEGGSYVIFKTYEAKNNTAYGLITGNDTKNSPGRNWKSWKIYGANVKGDMDDMATRDFAGWKLIDQKSDIGQDQLPADNFVPAFFSFSEGVTTKYKYYRIEVEAAYDGNSIQMSEFKMFTDEEWKDVCVASADSLNRLKEKVIGDNELEESVAAEVAAAIAAVSNAQPEELMAKFAAAHEVINAALKNNFLAKYQLTEKDGVLQIATAADLFNYAKVINAGTTKTENTFIDAVLTADIDLSEAITEENPWIPIGDWSSGNVSTAFKGHFDGQGYTIKGFNAASSQNYFGIFGVISTGALVENFDVYGTITLTHKTGGVVGYARDATPTIRNIHSYLNINNATAGNRPGGILGSSVNGTIEVQNCTYSGTMDANDNANNGNYGGIVGYVNNNAAAILNITNCLYDGKMINSAETPGNCTVGGFVGYSNGGIVTIKNSLSIGTVQSKIAAQFFGAVKNAKSALINCYYVGENVNGSSSTVTIPANEVTDEQLKSGEVAAKLAPAFRQNIGDDEAPVLAPTHAIVAEITEAGYATLFIEGTDVVIPEGVVAFAAVVENDILKLNAIDGKVAAGEPVVLKGAAGFYGFAPTTEAVKADANDLKGAAEDVEAAGKYVLAKPEGKDAGFYLADKGTIKAGKAYLEIANGVKSYVFAGDDETGIESLTPAFSEGEGAIYNLSGQRVSKAQKGIYIINGKKVLK